jgi:hypothetical protein
MCNDRLRLMLEVDVVQQLRFWAKFPFLLSYFNDPRPAPLF